MSAYSTIEIERVAHVATIRLNQPKRRNPIGSEVVAELLQALDELEADSAIRVIEITGAGPSFSAGADLSQYSEGQDDAKRLSAQGDYAKLLLRFTTLTKPTVAKVRGHALGGGLGLVASCSIAIASEDAVLGTPEVHVGLFPMMIMAVLEPLMPKRELLSMMLLGRRLQGKDAVRVGLVSEAVVESELDERVGVVTSRLAALPPTALSAGLKAYHHQSGRSLGESLPELRDRLLDLMQTDEAKEGIRAFLEKRKPSWASS